MPVSHPLVSDINTKLAAQFEKQVLEAAMHSLDQETNPLRLNHFATTLRELSRLVLHRLAPDAEVKACAWYVKPPDTDITRGQRITYAVHHLVTSQSVCREDFLHPPLASFVCGMMPPSFGLGIDEQPSFAFPAPVRVRLRLAESRHQLAARDGERTPTPFGAEPAQLRIPSHENHHSELKKIIDPK